MGSRGASDGSEGKEGKDGGSDSLFNIANPQPIVTDQLIAKPDSCKLDHPLKIENQVRSNIGDIFVF